MSSQSRIKAGEAYVELGVSDKLARGLHNAQRRLKAFSTSVKAVGMNLLRTSALLATPLAASVVVFARFEQQMARVRALTGATEKEFQQLAAEARRLGETTVFTAAQAADAMGFFALAGYKVEAILDSIGPTLSLAAAAQMDIAQTSDIALRAMGGMGVASKDVGHAMDVLVAAFTRSNTNLEELGDSFQYVGPDAHDAGVSFEEVGAALQIIADKGIRGARAGTSFRNVMTSLADQSPEAQQELKKLGVVVADDADNFRDLADIMGDFKAALKDKGTYGRLASLNKIFGKRFTATASALIEQGGAPFREATAKLRDLDGLADQVAKVQLNTLKGSATLLKSVLEGLGITVGEILSPALRAALTLVTRAVGAISKWVSGHKALVAVVVAAALGLGAMGATLLTVGLAAQIAAFALGGLAGIIGTVTGVLGAAAAAIGGILSPLGLATAAVVGLGAVVLTASGIMGRAFAWLRSKFGELGAYLRTVVKGMTDALRSGDTALAADILWLSLKLAWQKGAAELSRVWLTLKHFLLRTFTEVKSGLLVVGADMWHALGNYALDGVFGMTKAMESFSADAQTELQTIKYVALRAWNEIKGAFDEGFDVDAANEQAAAALIQEVDRLEAEKSKMVAALNQARANEQKEEQARYEGRLREIVAAEDAAMAELDARTAGDTSGTQKAIDDTVAKLKESLAKAATGVPEAGATGGAPGEKDPLAELQDRLAGLLDSAAQRVSVVGTFSSSSLKGLAAGKNTAERTAKAAEETAANTRRLARAQTTGGLAFS